MVDLLEQYEKNCRYVFIHIIFYKPKTNINIRQCTSHRHTPSHSLNKVKINYEFS